MRILIICSVTLNVGDAAILMGMVELLRREFGEQTKIVVGDLNPAISSKYFPELTLRKTLGSDFKMYFSDPALLPRLWAFARLGRLLIAAWCLGHVGGWLARLWASGAELKRLSEYEAADFVVAAGGTYLVEQYDIWPRIAEYVLVQALNKPLVFFTQSMGPFTRPRYRRTLRKIFSRAQAILVRDEASKRHIAQLGIGIGNVHVCGDAAFALTRNGHLAPVISSTRPQIAVSVRYWPYFKGLRAEEGMARFRYAMQALTHHLVEVIGAEVTYLSTCQGIPEYWTDDSKVAEEISAGLPEAVRCHVHVDRAFHHPRELVSRYAEFDAVIATRMHAAILALAGGAAVFPIAYEFKTRELFTRLGMSEWVQDIERMDAPALIRSADAFLHALPRIRTQVAEAVARERASASDSANIVRRAVAAGRERA